MVRSVAESSDASARNWLVDQSSPSSTSLMLLVVRPEYAKSSPGSAASRHLRDGGLASVLHTSEFGSIVAISFSP